jgi:transcriptional regulator
MLLRPDHAETSIPVLRQLIHDFPLGVLTTAIPSSQHPLIQSSHIPWILDVSDPTSATELGVLRGHMARANPQSKVMMDAAAASDQVPADGRASRVLEQEVLVLFTVPAHHYVTPKFYTATKPVTGKVVPTWNYAAAQAYGRLRVYYDTSSSETDEYLAKAVADLSAHAEGHLMGFTGDQGRAKPWTVDEAPPPYLGILRKAIIGVEVVLDRLEGKFKMSQEMGEGDRQGTADGFKALGTDVGSLVGTMVEERSAMKKEKDELRRREKTES